MSQPAPGPDESGRSPATAGQVQALDDRVGHLDTKLAQLSQELRTMRDILLLIHDDDPLARTRLQELRTQPSYEQAFTTELPLVSVVIPTWNSIDTLIERAIPSALAQTHSNIEVIVVGDCSPPEVGEAVVGLGEPRVSFHNLTVRGPYDEDQHRAWLASGTPGLNAGVALAKGQWIAPLGDDDAFVAEHVERLLAFARRGRLEFVYGRIRYTFPNGDSGVVGEFPPRAEQVGLQAAVYHAGLRFFELELGHALFEKPNDWGLVHRLLRTGVRMGMLDDVSVDYWPSMRALERHKKEQPATPSPPSPLPEVAAEQQLALIAELEGRVQAEHDRAEALAASTAELTRRLDEVRRSRSWRLTEPLRRLRSRS